MSGTRPGLRCVFLGYLWKAAEAIRQSENATLVSMGIEPQRARSAEAIRYAEVAGIEWFDARRLRENDMYRERLDDIDLVIVGAFGQILPAPLIQAPRLGTLNIHPSRLPAYRGGHAIEEQILAGESHGGVTVHWISEEVDAGPVAGWRTFEIGPHDDYEDVFETMHERAGALVRALLQDPDAIPRDTQPPPNEAVRSPRRRADLQVDWTMPAEQIDRLVRAYGWRDWIRGETSEGEWILHEVEIASVPEDTQAGTLLARDPVPVVATGAGAVRFVRAVDPLPNRPRVAMSQPTFLPWQGYFALLAAADVFIFLDDFQFVRHSFHQRNRLPSGKSDVMWVTVPVPHAGSDAFPALNQVPPVLDRFRDKFLRTIQQTYARAAFREPLFPDIARWIQADWPDLASFNEAGIRMMADWMGIETELRRSSEIGSTGQRSARVADLLARSEAGTYLAAAGAREYMVEDGVFPLEDVDTRFQQFEPQPYPQGRSDFHAYLSALDALLRVGPRETRRLIERGRRRFLPWEEAVTS